MTGNSACASGEVGKYLQEGPQTKMSPAIERAVSSLQGEGLDFVVSAVDWILLNVRREEDSAIKRQVFRKRTADRIITDGFTTGCTDTALVFIVLCRVKGFPTKYVEAIEKRWLEEGGTGKIKGHVFAECFINDRWFQVDPARAAIHIQPDHSRYVILGGGLDSWDLGIRSFSDLKNKFISFSKECRNLI